MKIYDLAESRQIRPEEHGSPNSLKEQARLIKLEKENRKEEKRERQRLKTEALQQKINEESNLTNL